MRRAVAVVALFMAVVPADATAAPLEEALGVPRIDLAGSVLGGEDVFIRRVGHGFRLTIRPVRFLGFDLLAAGFPDGGESDWTEYTVQTVRGEEVAPLVSRVLGMVHVGFQGTPLLGRIRAPGGGDGGEVGWYWTLGAGALSTRDDMELTASPCSALATPLERAEDPGCALVDQLHPAFVLASGLRVTLSPGVIVGFEGRFTVHPEEHFVGADEPLTEVRRTIWTSFYAGGSIPLPAP